MNYIYIIPGKASALIVEDVIELAQATARKFCASQSAEYLEDNFFVTGNIHKVYETPTLPGQKALAFMKAATVEQMSAYLTIRMYNTFDRAKHKTLFDIVTEFNAYRNSVFLNFGKKSLAELEALLYAHYGVIVPRHHYLKGRERIEITENNAMEFFKHETQDKFKK